MNKEINSLKIPKLRFQNLHESDGWELKRLNTIGKTLNGLTGKTGTDFGVGKPFVTYKQVFDNSKIDLRSCSKVKIFENETQNELIKGDVLFTTSSETANEIGYSSVILEEPSEQTYLNSFCFIFRITDQSLFDPHFARYFFHSPVYRKAIIKLAQGSTRFNISKIAFLKLNLPIPLNIQVQQKIANCLSSIDELISAQNIKISTLNKLKKGLMRNLFPLEGKTTPNLRFPEFKVTDGWEKTPLKKVGEIITGNTPSTSNSEYYGGNKLFVSPVDMADHRFIYKTKTTLTALGFEKTRKIPPASVLFVCIGSTIGKTAQNKFECATNQQINAVVPYKYYSSGFIYYSLDLNASKISELAGKQAVPIINKSLFSSVILNIPSFKEQHLVSEFLSSLDELINLQLKKIDCLKKQKKGLIQQLFPSSAKGIS